MTSADHTPEHALEPTANARRAFALNAALAWIGLALTVLLSALGWYREVPVEAGLYGDTPGGMAGVFSRLTDTLSYFTIWSNVVVAVSATLLLQRPLRDTMARRVLRLDALLMITVTAIVYQALIAPNLDVAGWSLLTDPILHIITPLVTVVVWAVYGPRGWISARLVPLALVVPLAWIVWMLARGAVVDAYPYGFANVTELGYGSVSLTLVAILVFGLVVAAAYWGADVLLRRGADRTS